MNYYKKFIVYYSVKYHILVFFKILIYVNFLTKKKKQVYYKK